MGPATSVDSPVVTTRPSPLRRRAEAEHERAAVRPSILGPFRKRSGDDRALLLGQARQVAGEIEVGVEDLVHRGACERQLPGAELRVGEGQRVLVGPLRDPPLEHLGGHVMRRHVPRVGGAGGIEHLGQAEVGQADRAADEEDVVRLDVAVLDADEAPVLGPVAMIIEEVDGAGQLLHVAEQLVARHAGEPPRLAGAEPVHQALVAQGHRDHEAIPDPLGELDVEQVGVADVPDHLQRPLLRARLAAAEPDELQRHMDVAGRDRLPDLAEPPTAEPPDEPVTREGGLSGDLVAPRLQHRLGLHARGYGRFVTGNTSLSQALRVTISLGPSPSMSAIGRACGCSTPPQNTAPRSGLP